MSLALSTVPGVNDVWTVISDPTDNGCWNTTAVGAFGSEDRVRNRNWNSERGAAGGAAVPTADSFMASGLIHLNYSHSGTVPTYSGLAPTLVGVGQVNYGLPPSKNAEAVIDLLPANGIADTVSNVLGISEQVRFSWAYHYVFGGLSITN